MRVAEYDLRRMCMIAKSSFTSYSYAQEGPHLLMNLIVKLPVLHQLKDLDCGWNLAQMLFYLYNVHQFSVMIVQWTLVIDSRFLLHPQKVSPVKVETELQLKIKTLQLRNVSNLASGHDRFRRVPAECSSRFEARTPLWLHQTTNLRKVEIERLLVSTCKTFDGLVRKPASSLPLKSGATSSY